MRAFYPAAVCLVASLLLFTPAHVAERSTREQGEEYPALYKEGEKRFAERSYALAHEVYLKADALELPLKDARWVDFRLADTLWRSQAGSKTADSTKFDRARKALVALVRDVEREEDRDRVWVEVQESIADFWWTRRRARNWGNAWSYYQAALDWWAGAEDIELARQRYLQMVWRMAKPRDVEPHFYYGYYGNIVHPPILENVLKIARGENDRAHAHYLLAMTVRYQGGDWGRLQRVPEEFEAAIRPGKSTDWHDDALFHYAQWMANQGRARLLENGQWTQQADYVKAVALYRQLLKEYEKGETRHYNNAKRAIKSITSPQVGVGVSNFFLPDSEVQYSLSWRNVEQVGLSLYPVDLTRDVGLQGDDRRGRWLHRIDLAGRERVASWTFETGDKGEHLPGSKWLRLEEKPPPGAYVIEAVAGKMSARDLILITDISVVLKTSGGRAIVYVCDIQDGAPTSGARVTLWERSYDGNDWSWQHHDQVAGEDGLAVYDLEERKGDRHRKDLFVSAVHEDRQAFSTGDTYRYYGRRDATWKIYALTDRPAYRPGETAHWKLTAREYDGAVYSTPAGASLLVRINDPRGAKVLEEEVKLNPFGSAWGSLELTEAMPLGEYQAQFLTRQGNKSIGTATLFRIEEYKLPEFKVSIQTPEEDGKKKAFKVGEKVEVSIEAEYYFGGPVAKATVEVLVYQNPFYHWWSPPREFPWFFEDVGYRPPRHWGTGQIVKRETLKTDAAGRAKLTFETPRGGQQDFEYRIEARVTDASRREIVGNARVRVTRQRYHVYLRPRHYLHHPQDKVEIDIKAIDSNDQPTRIVGTVTVTRDWWFEIWLDPNGKEVKGKELDALRQELVIFPPPPRDPRDPGWRLKFRGYQHDEILKRMVKTDEEGKAVFVFVPEREGYYRVSFDSKDEDGAPITSATTVWVATESSRDLGYHQGGVEILLDKDTFKAGQKAMVMLSVPTNDSHVLFTVEGEEIYSHRLVHVEGTVKLIELEIEERHVPNIFLGALLVRDRKIHVDTEQVVIPPVKQFLQVEVEYDQEVYQPRDEGRITITTRNHAGEPISAEVALGVADESVYYIQEDYAGDPRKFYFGSKRGRVVRTYSTFNHKAFTKLAKGGKDQLIEVAWGDDESRSDAGPAGGAGWSMAKGKARRSRGPAAPGARARSGALESNGAAPMDSAAGEAMFEAEGKEMSDMEALGAPGGGEAAVQVRSDFRSTVVWQPDIVTDQEGRATVEVKFPDSLTSWRASARVVTQENHFGVQKVTTRTRKPLIARLQAPRFFLVGDSVTVSAVINNNTDEPMTVMPVLKVEGVVLAGVIRDGKPAKGEAGPVEVPANGESRIDWAVSVLEPGEAKLTVIADGEAYNDAMEKRYLVYEHGMEKLVAKAVKLRGEDVTVKLEIPKERRADSTVLTVQLAPSLAVTMLDALPYLIDYPYGCTEQTMSRFLPAVITAKTLKDLGIDPQIVMEKAFGGIQGEHAGKTQPGGKKDLKKLDDMVKKGLDRLYDFQHNDGGWGWWKQGKSDHFMTAYVVWGLSLARSAGVEIRDKAIIRGREFLNVEIVEEENNLDMQAWMLHALSVDYAERRHKSQSKYEKKALENLWEGRSELNAYTRALFALAAHHYGDDVRAQALIRNLQNGVKLDKTPDTSVIQRGKQESQDGVVGTAHWGEDGVFWRWSDGGIEATSFALKALLTIDPKNELVEPVTNWLIKNRRGAQWKSTRDTAITILALNQYLRESGELTPDLEYELLVNGRSVTKQKLTSEAALSAPSRFSVDPGLLKDGTNEIRVVRKGGESPLYFSAEARFFSLEEPITPAGNEIFVRRQYYKLVGRPTLLKGYVYRKVQLDDGDTVTSGERVEAVITIEGKNNYEYLVFEDLKPAGLEAVQVRSGDPLHARELKSGAVDRQFPAEKKGDPGRKGSRVEASDYTGRSRWVYQELRDRKVALFLDKMPEGVWEIRYDLRAEVPGRFHALPVTGYAMYVPEIRCNGAEARITVDDR